MAVRQDRTEPPMEILSTRAEDSTTFEMCGWCKYHGSGSYRYNAMLHGTCDLLGYLHNGHDRNWDSPCDVAKLGKADLAYVLDYHHREISQRLESNKRTEGYIAVLEGMSFTERPILPEFRAAEHFNVGEECYVFYEDSWHHGTVALGYRHHDGCVSYVMDDVPESATTGPWGCGVQVPCVLRKDEYDFFATNHDHFREWLRLSDRDYNGDRLPLASYYHALAVLEAPPSAEEAG